MRLADLPEVRALSTHQKLELVDELWRDVTRDLESLEVSVTEKRLLDERWAAFLKDPCSGLEPEEFRARVKALRA